MIFGKEILDPKGQIDRKILAREAFQSVSKQEKLNKIMHPLVRKKVSQWIGSQERRTPSPSLVVVEVPLIFERGYHRFFDGVLSISSLPKTRRERLLRRGWSLDEIRRREKLQWSQSQKDKKSDWVIFNRGVKNDLNYAIDRWLAGFENS
jgi:dephospho-CoA kinase